MTLKGCTKEELLWIIDYLCKRSVFGLDYDILQALNEIAFRREEKRLDEANRLNQLSIQARLRAAELLEPYNGKSIVDIPHEIVKQAGSAIEEAQILDKKWDQLMRVKRVKKVDNGNM